MKIKLTAQHFKLKLQHPFSISRYTVNNQNTVVVCISNNLISGYGEATVNPYYNSTVEGLLHAIESVRSIVETNCGIHPEKLWQIIAPLLANDYFALCAIDCAYWDFYARHNKMQLRRFWSEEEDKYPLTNYTIGIDDIDKMCSKIKEHPWPIYKIKLGVPNDLEIITSLRSVTSSVFRIDANCAWGVEETIEKSGLLKALNVEFIEQPLPAKNWQEMALVKQHSRLPIIADESCKTLDDVEKCANAFHGINIKLMKCGGITPALQMIQKARALGLKIMLGCMTESSVGISALTQLAPLVDYLDADGAMLLANDVATGVSFNDGNIMYSTKFGTGVSLNP